MMSVDDRPALIGDDDLAALGALRDVLAEALVNAEPKEIAALSREYRNTRADLRTLGAGKEGSVLDEISARRARRRAGAPPAENPGSAAVGVDIRP